MGFVPLCPGKAFEPLFIRRGDATSGGAGSKSWTMGLQFKTMFIDHASYIFTHCSFSRGRSFGKLLMPPVQGTRCARYLCLLSLPLMHVKVASLQGHHDEHHTWIHFEVLNTHDSWLVNDGNQQPLGPRNDGWSLGPGPCCLAGPCWNFWLEPEIAWAMSISCPAEPYSGSVGYRVGWSHGVWCWDQRSIQSAWYLRWSWVSIMFNSEIMMMLSSGVF